jgi:hypothetical protein
VLQHAEAMSVRNSGQELCQGPQLTGWVSPGDGIEQLTDGNRKDGWFDGRCRSCESASSQRKKQDRGLFAWRAGANAAWLLPRLGFVLAGAILTAIMNAVIPLLIIGCQGSPKAAHQDWRVSKVELPCGAAGNVNSNIAPRGVLALARNRSPCASTIDRQIASRGAIVGVFRMRRAFPSTAHRTEEPSNRSRRRTGDWQPLCAVLCCAASAMQVPS